MKRTLLYMGAALIALLALLAVLLASFDWNRIKPWLNQRVSDAAGRPFAIRGELSLKWQKPQSEDMQGWRAIVPWPHLQGRDIVMGNPPWARASSSMAQVEQADFAINPFPLLSQHIQVPELVLRQPALVLERDAQGRNNWTFPSKQEKSGWTLELGRLQLENGELRLVDAIRKADLTLLLQSLAPADASAANEYQMTWALRGKLEQEDVAGNGRAGPLLALRESSRPYPFQGRLKVGRTQLEAEGTVARPRTGAAVDLRLVASGPSMAKLLPITTVLLPETPPFRTEGHLVGQAGEHGGTWRYENFKGRVGQSDISGTLEYQGRSPRPLLKGRLESTLLRLIDLGPVIGKEDAPQGDDKKTSKRRNASDRVLPERPFSTSNWNKIDAQLSFRGHRIERGNGLAFENMQTELRLDQGLLTLEPLRFGMAGGKLDSHIALDGRGKTLQAKLRFSARALQLEKLFPKVGVMKASVGRLNADGSLQGRGASIAGILGQADGSLSALVDGGSISKFVLEAMGLNVGSVVVTRLFGDKQVQLNCLASDIQVKQGIARPRLFVLDTADAIVHVEGEADLGKETLNLVVHPESRGLRLFSLRSPLYVTGSFRHPDVDVNRAQVAAKAGGAVALGVLAPVATALLPLIQGGQDEPSACRSLLQEAAKGAAQAGKK